MRFQTFTTLASCVLTAAMLPAQLGAQPAHLIQAQNLLTSLQSNSSNVNKYGTTSVNPMDGTSAHIDWSGSPRTAISECSTFFSLLLEQTYYNNNKSAFETHTAGHPSPTAAMYHDNINNGLSFTKVTDVTQLQPGDTIAVAYAPNSNPTGHVMTVVSAGTLQNRSNSTQSFLQNNAYSEIALFMDVLVIDSTQYPHGPGDTRYPSKTGIGQGVIRLFFTQNHVYTGYTSSTGTTETYNSQLSNQHDAAFGRWIP